MAAPDRRAAHGMKPRPRSRLKFCLKIFRRHVPRRLGNQGVRSRLQRPRDFRKEGSNVRQLVNHSESKRKIHAAIHTVQFERARLGDASVNSFQHSGAPRDA